MNPVNCSRTKRATITILLAFIVLVSASGMTIQTGTTISGRVVDARTKQPLRLVSVFLANTMMGSSTNEKGEYIIERVPPGKYDLTISCVGFKLQQVPVTTTADPVNLNFELLEDVLYLKEVVVKSNFDLKKWRAEFIRRFVGNTPNARECVVENIDKVDLDYDEQTRIFSASCGETIEIVNNSLGYRIHYLLALFQVDQGTGSSIIAGVPRFEQLQSTHSAQRKKWQRKRDQAYYGSMNHLIRSLKSRKATENKFELYGICGGVKSKVDPANLISGESLMKLDSKCILEIIYDGQRQKQRSQLHLLDGSLRIYDNGYYEDQLRVNVYGYYSQHENIEAELLPLEYQPTPRK